MLRVAFETVVFFDELVIVGNHRTTARITVIPVNGAGDVTMRFRNVTFSAKASLSLINGDHLNFNDFKVRLRVEDADAALTGFGILNDVVSNAITSSLTAIINLNNGELLGRIIEGTVNTFLNRVRLRDVILSIVGRSNEDDNGFAEASTANEVDEIEIEQLVELLQVMLKV